MSKILNNIPNKLYHATYKSYLSSIYQRGLLPEGTICNWGKPREYGVYLATDKDIAESYAESAENSPASYLEDIIILEIDTNGLDKNKFDFDPYVLREDLVSTIVYKGIIPPSAIIEL